VNKVTFLVAFFALLQAASGTPSFAQERFPDDSRRNAEESLELASQDIADEIEELLGFKVDLVSKNGIKEKYLKAIDSDLIYV
jgi:hypothetical protein